MDALELPSRPSLEQYKKQAKEFLDAQAGDPKSLARLKKNHPQLARHSHAEALELIREHVKRAGFTAETFGLTEAQFIIARYHGFESWPKFARHIELMNQSTSPVTRFERGADAIASGDIRTLGALLKENPALIRERSTRSHHATLLHYVSANGVEDFRQKTPPNAVEIARLLLEAGAEVDATAETYGGGSLQTTMNLLVSSIHPAAAGLQGSLTEVLLDFGAAINGVADDESPILTALAFGYAHAAQVLARRGARLGTLLSAAGIGREDLVEDMLDEKGAMKPGVPRVKVKWVNVADDAKDHVTKAVIWAARLGHARVVELLLRSPVDLGAKDMGLTALHWAAARGYLDIVKLLLDKGADLESVNEFGGRVLDSTMWFSANDPQEGVDYAVVIRALIAAGSRTDVYPEQKDEIEAVLSGRVRPS